MVSLLLALHAVWCFYPLCHSSASWKPSLSGKPVGSDDFIYQMNPFFLRDNLTAMKAEVLPAARWLCAYLLEVSPVKAFSLGQHQGSSVLHYCTRTPAVNYDLKISLDATVGGCVDEQ